MIDSITLHQGRTDAKPEDAGFDSTALQRLNDHYASLIGKQTVQGASYLLARHGKIFAHTSMGKLTFKEDSPDLLPNSIRNTYSITKFITAVAIIQLIERGQLYLMQPVSSILPPFDTSLHRSITVFQLLTHTSGLRPDPGFNFEPYQLPWFEWGYREVKKKNPEMDWLQIILTGPLVAEPGTEWHYSTACYAVLGEIISRVSGKPYHTYIQDEIMAPLGMNRSFFLTPEQFKEEVSVTGPWEMKGLEKTEFNPDEPPKAGNGMYSTTEDLWRLGQMMLNGGSLDGVKILSKRSVELMTRNHLSGIRMTGWGADERDHRFGLGLGLDDFDLCTPGTYNHEGYGQSGLYIDPVEQIVFAYIAPTQKGYTHESVVIPKAIVWSGIL